MRMSREFFVPREYSAKIVPKGVKAEIYLIDKDTGPVAMGFGGRRSKPDFNIRFRSKERRQEYVKNYVERMQERDKINEEGRKNRNNKGRGLELGSVLCCSWGYDQTNINYYEVIKLVGDKSVMIVPIASSLVSQKPPEDRVKPAKGVRREYDVLLGLNRGWEDDQPEGVLKRAVDGSVSLNGRQTAYLCDPNETSYETSSGWGR